MLQIARASIYFSKSMLYIFKHTHRYTVIRYKVFIVYYKRNISTESKVGQYNPKGKENRQCGEKEGTSYFLRGSPTEHTVYTKHDNLY